MGLSKSLTASINALEKKGEFTPSDGVSVADRAERLALEIERAVHDTHPNLSAYGSQVRTLLFNLKSNVDLTARLLAGTLTPTMLAAMSSDELATEELQKSNAEMVARAEKQAIKITEDGPRIRKTHKGEEVIGGDVDMVVDKVPSPLVAPETASEQDKAREPPAQLDLARSPTKGLAVSTQQSPTKADFDINKVFSSVKSPTLTQGRHRLSISTAPAGGPGIDPEVDRFLDDGTQSPPYSPSAESDPDVVWRGNLVMNTIATVQVSAKHIGGAKLSESIQLPWNKLIPKSLSVCGRIDEHQAIVYLCGLRYSLPTDIVVVNLEPGSEASKPEFQKIFDYFVSKKRYGVIGDKGVANVRDTYLVPVLPGTGNHPEFMYNLQDNFIPETRTEPMLLAVFVYRNDPETLMRVHGTADAEHAKRQHELATQPNTQHGQQGFVQSPGTPTPSHPGFPQGGRQSISAPAFSPATPQGTFPNYPTPRESHHPLQQPQLNASGQREPDQPVTGYRPAQDPAQVAAEAIARQVLGPLIISPTVNFLLPQAQTMSTKEWEVIKNIYEQDPRARDDLPYLSSVLERVGNRGQSAPGAPPTPTPAPAPAPAPAPRRKSQPKVQPSQAPLPGPAVQTPVPPPQPPHAIRNTPIPPPPIPHVAAAAAAPPPRQTPPRQTPIPPPPIPPQAAAAAGAPPA